MAKLGPSQVEPRMGPCCCDAEPAPIQALDRLGCLPHEADLQGAYPSSCLPEMHSSSIH